MALRSSSDLRPAGTNRKLSRRVIHLCLILAFSIGNQCWCLKLHFFNRKYLVTLKQKAISMDLVKLLQFCWTGCLMLTVFFSFGLFSEFLKAKCSFTRTTKVYTLIHFNAEFWQFKTHQPSSLETFLFIATLVCDRADAHTLASDTCSLLLDGLTALLVYSCWHLQSEFTAFWVRFHLKWETDRTGCCNTTFDINITCLHTSALSLLQLQSNAQLEVK